MKARVAGVSVLGPGLDDWAETRAVLDGSKPWTSAPTPMARPAVMSPRERRRASPLVSLFLNAAAAACDDAGMAPDAPDCVFASALGDGAVTHAILEAICGPEKLVSPTHFHNSVHNAPAGYWSLAVGNRNASTSLAAGDGTFGAALLKAVLTAHLKSRPVLLVAADHPFPDPLADVRPVAAPFAVGLVLLPETERRDAPLIVVEATMAGAPTPPRLADLRGIWESCPPARALPLLEGLESAADIVVNAGSDHHLAVRVSP